MPGIPICAHRSAAVRSAAARQPHHSDRQSYAFPAARSLSPARSGTLTQLSAGLILAGFSVLAAIPGPALAREEIGHSVPAATAGATANGPVVAANASSGLIVSATNVTVDNGNTLSRLLAAQGVPEDNRRAVLAALSDMIDPASLPPGARLRLTFAPAPNAPVANTRPAQLVQTIELMSGDSSSLMVHIDAAHPVSDQDVAHALQARAAKPAAKASIWKASQAPSNQDLANPDSTSQGAGNQVKGDQAAIDEDGQFVVRHATGTVGKGLRAALLAQQLPPALVDEILLGFKAGPDQRPALHPAANFEVIYEGVQRDGKLDEPQLRYAMVDDGGKTRRIYRYQTDDQTTALMQEDGHGVALVDLGKPLQIDARITSPYGWRIHPVFGDRRFHEGVDFGAPTGTPVVATSDGVVEDIGWRGNYGKYVRLRHDGHLATAYAHLSGFARGLQRGSTVKRGDVIAYVGRSGVATGPHLYYEVLVDGKQIDPMKSIPGEPVSLTGQQLAEFQKYVEKTPEE